MQLKAIQKPSKYDLGTDFIPLPIEVFGFGVPDLCEPLWFGGNTRGSPNLR